MKEQLTRHVRGLTTGCGFFTKSSPFISGQKLGLGPDAPRAHVMVTVGCHGARASSAHRPKPVHRECLGMVELQRAPALPAGASVRSCFADETECLLPNVTPDPSPCLLSFLRPEENPGRTPPGETLDSSHLGL